MRRERRSDAGDENKVRVQFPGEGGHRVYLEAIISAGITSARDWSDQATPSGKLKCHHHHYQPPSTHSLVGSRAAQVTTRLSEL